MVGIIAGNSVEAKQAIRELGLKDTRIITSPESMCGLHLVSYIFVGTYYTLRNIEELKMVARENVCHNGGLILFEERG